MTIHSLECQQKHAEWEAKIRKWEQCWPNYCRKCDGHGAFSWPDTWNEPGGAEPCEVCTFQGICARCGQPGLTSEERGDDSTGDGPCKQCGWDYEDGLPSPWECWGDCQPTGAP